MSDRNTVRAILALPALIVAWLAIDVAETWARRLPYPFDLEWMEGGVLAHAWRIQHLEPVYADPGAGWIPMIYPPGYTTLLAALGTVFGLSPGLGRFVSIVGTLAALAALVWFGKRQFDRWMVGVLGAGIYLGMYEASGAFYDLVRPDGLFIGLLAWAVVLTLEDDERTHLGAGVLLFLAFTVKHNAAAFGFPLALGLWARRGWQDALRFGLAAAGPALLWTGLMQATSDGHFLTWILEVPQSHPLVWGRVMPGTVRELGAHLPVVSVVVGLAAMAVTTRVARPLPEPAVVVPAVLAAAVAAFVLDGMGPVAGIGNFTLTEAFPGYFLFGSGLVCLVTGVAGMAIRREANPAWILGAGLLFTGYFTSGMMRGHHGGFINVFMAAHWTFALAFTAVLGTLIRELGSTRGAGVAAVAATLQLGWLALTLDTQRLEPTDADYAAGREIVDYLQDAPGPVLSPFAPWIPALAGHEPSFHLIALWDIRHKEGPYRDNVEAVAAAVRNHRWGTILDAEQSWGYGTARFYEQEHVFDLDPRVLMPRTGWRRRPTVVWRPKDD